MNQPIQAITDDLCFIQRGWLNGNHFVQTGPEVVIIDSGYLPYWDETEALIIAAGARIEDTSLLISTHSHCDHIGGNARIAARSGCGVAMHEIDRYFVNRHDGWAMWWRYYGQEAEPFPVDRGLSDGEVLALGGLEWQVIHAPGHGMGQICLFAPDTGWLISADAAWDGDFGVLTTHIEGLGAPLRQRETLERLAGLPVTAMYPGHGAMVADGRAAIGRCLERINRFIEDPMSMIIDQVRKIMLYSLMMKGPMTAEAYGQYLASTVWFPDLCGRYFNGRVDQVFQENLKYLIERGLINDTPRGLGCALPA